MKTGLMTTVFLGLTAIACAQCGPGGCAIDEWREIDGDPGRVYLFRKGQQIGGWDFERGVWRSYDARLNRWGEPTSSPPLAPPVRKVVNFGVDSTKFGGRPYQLNGRPATRQEIDAAIGAQLPDDSKKFRLVATGDSAERQRIADAWQPMEPAVKSRVAVWSVPANHWSLQDTTTGKTVFRTGGITFLAPDGKVLHRQPDFTGSEDFTAIRKAIKAYDSAKDPDLRKEAPVPLPTPTPVTPTPANNLPPLLALFAVAAINFYLRKKGT